MMECAVLSGLKDGWNAANEDEDVDGDGDGGQPVVTTRRDTTRLNEQSAVLFVFFFFCSTASIDTSNTDGQSPPLAIISLFVLTFIV